MGELLTLTGDHKMNSAKLKSMNRIDVLQARDTIMAGLREALAVIQKQNITIAKLQNDVSFLEKEYKSAKYLLAENRKANRARIRADQHLD